MLFWFLEHLAFFFSFFLTGIFFQFFFDWHFFSVWLFFSFQSPCTAYFLLAFGSLLVKLFPQSVKLESLAMYFNSDSSPWTLDKPWEDLLPSEWSQVPSSCFHLLIKILGLRVKICIEVLFIYLP
jgi:hypothetical protein